MHQPFQTIVLRRVLTLAGWLLVLVAIAWGARLTVLEGFVAEWRPVSEFGGDFNAALLKGVRPPGPSGGSGVMGQGHGGGSDWSKGAMRSRYHSTGGGGGGAGAIGADATSSGGGKGGDGIVSTITGTPMPYAGGGGGGADEGTGGAGGLGGGGMGGNAHTSAAPGMANTGGGGGGGGGGGTALWGAPGGAGIVVVRYKVDAVRATGGAVEARNGDAIHTFVAPGRFVVEATRSPNATVDLLVVGGGGGGGHTGGGGAGGYRQLRDYPVAAQTYVVQVGAGGDDGGFGSNPGEDGRPSMFGTIVAAGGGGGAGLDGIPGRSGGSGGGGSAPQDPNQLGDWSGNGIVYGPIFVIERWLVEWQPRVFRLTVFALANVVLAAGAFVFCVKASRARFPSVMISLAAWLCYWRLFYSFSVAANPEFLELFFLSAAWFALSRQREAAEGALVGAAALTKLIPYVFVVPLVVRRSLKGMAAMAAIVTVTILVVGLGQHLPLREILVQSFFPFAGRRSTNHPFLMPVMDSNQYYGLLEGLIRAFTGPRTDVPANIFAFQVAFVAIVAAALALTFWATIRLVHRRAVIGDTACGALTYAMYFALIPLLTISTHAHTFLFLLPIWVVYAVQLADPRQSITTRAVVGVLVAFCYVQTGLPAVVMMADRVFRTSLVHSVLVTDPILGNVLLIFVTCGYVFVRTATPRMEAVPALHV